MTTDDLDLRGFVKHWRLGTFYGWCGYCKSYQSIAWWSSPAPVNHAVTACDVCGRVPLAEHRHVTRYPVVRAA